MNTEVELKSDHSNLGVLKREGGRLVDFMKKRLRSEAEGAEAWALPLLVDNMVELTDIAKSGAHDYSASDVLSVVALSLSATSPIENDRLLKIEDNGHPYYDILRVGSIFREDGRTINIPVPLIKPTLMDDIAKSLADNGKEIPITEKVEHNRKFEEDAEKMKEAARKVYIEIGTLASEVPLEHLVGVVLDPRTEDGKRKIRNAVKLIKDCREALKTDNGINDLAEKRVNALGVIEEIGNIDVVNEE